MKPIAKAKKKKKRLEEISTLMDPKAQRKLEREAENHLIDMEERGEARYLWAKTLRDQQSEDVRGAINRMAAAMGSMANDPKFIFKGAKINVDGGEERLRNLQYRTHLWFTLRLFVACAEWGIQIGDFKAPAKQCLRCGKDV